MAVNTPSHHRVHHGSDPKYIDRNHAGTLIVWDKLFGTFQREEEEPVYGITTPLSRWDPLTANFHYWGDLFRLAAQARTWGDKLRVFIKPPGWRPAYLGGYAGPEGKDRHTFLKFDTRVPAAVGGYVAVQFSLLLVVTTFFLFRQADLGATRQWATAALIVVWVMNMGLLMEGRRWATSAELVRVATLSLLLWQSTDLLPGTATIAANALVTLGSLALLWNAHRAMDSAPVNSPVTPAD